MPWPENVILGGFGFVIKPAGKSSPVSEELAAVQCGGIRSDCLFHLG